MRNHTLTPRTGERAVTHLAAFHRGWVDVGNGRDLDPDAFGDKGLQSSYENGRLAALNVIKAGPMPTWSGDQQAFESVIGPTIERAARLLGEALPGHVGF